MTKNIIKKKCIEKKNNRHACCRDLIWRKNKAKDFLTMADSIPSLNSFGVNLKWYRAIWLFIGMDCPTFHCRLICGRQQIKWLFLARFVCKELMRFNYTKYTQVYCIYPHLGIIIKPTEEELFFFHLSWRLVIHSPEVILLILYSFHGHMYIF